MDFGLRRLGLAVSDPSGTLASPFREIRIGSVREAPDAVSAIALEEDVAAVVVGVPLGLEGEESRTEVRRVERFAKALRRASGLPVHLVDESMSSREAEEKTGGGGKRGQGDALHAAAAAVILQRWLDRPRASSREGRP